MVDTNVVVEPAPKRSATFFANGRIVVLVVNDGLVDDCAPGRKVPESNGPGCARASGLAEASRSVVVSGKRFVEVVSGAINVEAYPCVVDGIDLIALEVEDGAKVVDDIASWSVEDERAEESVEVKPGIIEVVTFTSAVARECSMKVEV